MRFRATLQEPGHESLLSGAATESAPRLVDRNKDDNMKQPGMFPSPVPSSFNNIGTAIVWFRNDLRVGDNAVLALANTAQRVVPVYIFDERFYSLDYPSPNGFQRTGPFRAYFILEAVKALRSALRWRMSELVVRVGITEDILADIAETLLDAGYGPVHVVAQKEVTADEVELERNVAEAFNELVEDAEDGITTGTHFVWGDTLLHPDDLPIYPSAQNFPLTFTEFRKLVQNDENWIVRDEIKPPERFCDFPRDLDLLCEEFPTLRDDLHVAGLGDPHDYPFPHPLGILDYQGGENIAEDRLKEWVWKQKFLSTYCISMNESGNREGSSKLSAWLSIGCVSPRTIYWSCKKFEEQVKRNKSTLWFVVQLLRRDHFRWLAAKAGNPMFALSGFPRQNESRPIRWHLPSGTITAADKARFEAWTVGMTGAPYIDSAMRELANTGFMSARCRQNTASFLIHNLRYPDWRAGAEYFESLLIDYDAASNWGNWAKLAGVGPDPRGGQPLNVTKQAMWCDPTGWFITRWCGELWQLPAPMVHEPHLVDDEVLELMDIVPGKTYPRPIVELPRVEDWEYPKPGATRGVPSLFGHSSSGDDEDGDDDPEVRRRRKEETMRILKDLVVIATSPDDPRYAASQTPGEIGARKEAEKYI
jgi:deoxyribodipyrimidine photo-lyase